MANPTTTYTAISPLRDGSTVVIKFPKARIESREGIAVEAELYGPYGFVAGGPVDFLSGPVSQDWKVA